jgi:hypothetical protein
MSTLAAGATFAEVAEILHAATTLGHSAWGGELLAETAMVPGAEEKLRHDLTRLFTILLERQLPYVLVGGLAILAYVDGRNTQDVDLVLSLESLRKLPEIVLSECNSEFGRGLFGSLRVNVLLSSNPLFKLVQEKYATTRRFLETDVRCASVEGLILLKLYALPSLYRQGDGQRIGLYENDIFMLCERYRPKIEPLLQTLKPYTDQDSLRELQNIMMDIQHRIERVDKARQKAGPPTEPDRGNPK